MRVFGVISYFLENVLCMRFISLKGGDATRKSTEQSIPIGKKARARKRENKERKKD
jgi:hypothetical protein